MNEFKNSFYKEAEEKALLSAILNDLELYRKLRPKLSRDLFFATQTGLVWDVLRDIESQKKEPSLVLVEDYLQNRDSDVSVLDWAYDGVISGMYNSPYDLLLILQNHLQKRKLIDFRSKVDALVSTTNLDQDEVLGNLTNDYLKLLNDSSVNTEMEYADVTVSRLYDEIADGNKLMGISTGFKCLDDKIMGLKAGDMFVIGAQTSIGKTALALNIARNVASDGKEVAFFSLEMRPEKLYLRIASTILGVAANKIANQNYWNKYIEENLGDVLAKVGKFPIRMPPCEKFSVERIVNMARQAHQKKKIDLIVIDYLQIINDPKAGENRAAYISNVCSELKALAMMLGIPLIVLAQVNRATNKGEVHKPELWHLKESGSIEQAADVVVLIHRNKYAAGSEGYDESLGDVHALLRIVKNREGECADLLVSYDPEITQFTEMSEDEIKKTKYWALKSGRSN